MAMTRAWVVFEICKPYTLMTLNQACIAVYMIILQYLISKGVSAPALLVYKEIVATVFLSLLAYFMEKKKRPPITFKILCYSFVLGLLQITLCLLLLSICLEYVTAAYESIALNLQTAVTFVLAVFFGQEKIRFCSIDGQAKVWGVVLSAAGALMMVLWTGPTLMNLDMPLDDLRASSDKIIGITMIVVAILAVCFWNIFVGHVSTLYPAMLSLTAIYSFFGLIQMTIVAAFIVSKSSWELKWEGGLVLFAVLFGGITVQGLVYYVQTWCVHTKGPVFMSAFSPLLIVFTFLLDTFVLGDSAHLGSIIGAVFIVAGLYMILWAKAKDSKRETQIESSLSSPLIQQQP